MTQRLQRLPVITLQDDGHDDEGNPSVTIIVGADKYICSVKLSRELRKTMVKIIDGFSSILVNGEKRS